MIHFVVFCLLMRSPVALRLEQFAQQGGPQDKVPRPMAPKELLVENAFRGGDGTSRSRQPVRHTLLPRASPNMLPATNVNARPKLSPSRNETPVVSLLHARGALVATRGASFRREARNPRHADQPQTSSLSPPRRRS